MTRQNIIKKLIYEDVTEIVNKNIKKVNIHNLYICQDCNIDIYCGKCIDGKVSGNRRPVYKWYHINKKLLSLVYTTEEVYFEEFGQLYWGLTEDIDNIELSSFINKITEIIYIVFEDSWHVWDLYWKGNYSLKCRHNILSILAFPGNLYINGDSDEDGGGKLRNKFKKLRKIIRT